MDKLYDQDGNCDTYNYNSTTGYLDSVKDNDTGAQINYTYDENRGQLISVSQTDSYTDVTAQNNYTYDESGKLLTKINHSNTDYIIDYDKFYNTTENKVGSQVLTAFDYGTNNNILQKVTYGNGQTINYNYDKYGNVKELFYNGKLAFSFLSDKTGTVMRHKDFVNNRQYDYDYDTTGRLVRQVKTDISKTDAENKFVSAYEYDYDLNNNITKLASKNGDSSIVHSFTYGKDNLLTEYSSDVSSKVTYTYDGLNRQTKSSVALKTPLDMSYTYYDSNRGENFTTTKIKEETIGKDTYKYEYDTNGNITDIYKKVNNDWQRLYLYEYDEFNQLITFCDYINQKQYRYDYDEAGNILTETVSRIGAHGQLYDSRVNTYGYDDSNWGDKLTSYNGETITYDEIGNPLSYRDGMEMSWLNGRKLTTLQSGNDSISYKYDSNGVRTSKTVNGVEYTYEYLNGKLMHEIRGEKVFDYCYDANGQLYAVSYKANSSTDAVTYYYAHNWRGDITSIYDAGGNVVAKYEYDDWGNVLTVTDASNSEITNPAHIANLNPFRYRSYYYDSESGLYYLMSRYYDSVTHRFVNADGYFQSGNGILDTNMNAYCQNNPIMNYDPTGGCYYASGKWCHDAWEYIGGYERKPDPKAIDITDRLNKEMQNNAKKLSSVASIPLPNNIGSIAATTIFVNNVRPGGVWDFKSQDSWGLVSEQTYRYENTLLRFDDIGNIHYGYVGRVLFSENKLLLAGGVVQIATNTSDISYWNSNFDDPRDQKMISIGSSLWDKNNPPKCTSKRIGGIRC
nr:polymorphic toxin type 44 domain-containing protein [uncultured Ruminococcus sp.]